MIDFNAVELCETTTPFVMPAAESHYLTRRMRAAGIEFEYYSWREVMGGDAPLAYEDAMSALRPFEEADSFSVSPCVVVSKVQPEDMLGLAMKMFAVPGDPDYLIRNNVNARVSHLTIYDSVASDWPYEFEYYRSNRSDKPLVLRSGLPQWFSQPGAGDPQVIELAGQIAQGVSDGRLAKELLQEGGARWKCCPTEDFLRDQILNEFYKEGSAGAFQSDSQVRLMVEEAIASMANEIASWLTSETQDDPAVVIYFELDEDNYPKFPEPLRFEGTYSDSHGFMCGMITPSVKITLTKGGSTLGFSVQSIEPDFGTLLAKRSNRDFAAFARKTLHDDWREGSWFDCTDHSVREYLCDWRHKTPAVWGQVWIVKGEEDWRYVEMIAPCENPAIKHAIYLMEGDIRLVTTTADELEGFSYDDGFESSAPTMDMENLSSGPHAGLFDRAIVLDSPEMLDAFRALNPIAARDVEDMRRIMESYWS